MNGSKFDWLGKWLSRLGLGLLLYLLPPLLVILDEEVLKTHWIGNHISKSLGALFCKIYPWVCQMFGG